MRSTARPRSRVLGPAVIAVVLTAGVGAGPGIAVAGADELGAPEITRVRFEGSNLFISFVDHASEENGFRYTVRERDNPDRVLVNDVEVPGGVPGANRESTHQFGDIPAGVPVCATMRAYRMSGSGISFRYADSGPSNTLCTDPAAAQTDVALQTIRGAEFPPADQAPAYLVMLRNAGNTDAAGVVVDISTSGVAVLGDHGPVAAGWNANGFDCAVSSPTAMRCTGGTVRKGQQINPAVIVRFTGPGFGAIHAQAGGAGDTNPGNNGTALNVTAE